MKDGAAAAVLARCGQTALTAAYLDGELAADAAARFEAHAKECPDCSASLLEQRRLLCLLDAAFDQTFEKGVTLPRDFTRAVKARAQTDMTGLRDKRERARALKLCAGLAAATVVLVFVTASDAVLTPLVDAARASGSVLGVAARGAADAGAGAGLVARAVGGRFGVGHGLFAALMLLVFAAACAILLRLVSRYHRAGD